MDGGAPESNRDLVWPAKSAREQSLERLASELCELWGHLNAATFRFLELVALFDAEKGYERHGLASCAHWLSWQCGIGTVAAREKVRVARALERLPKIRDSFRRGVISYSKVRAMTRIAVPDTEAALLNVAEHGTAAHVEKLVRKYCWVERLEDARRASAQHHHRYLKFGYDDDGSMLIRVKLPPEIGALVQKAIEAAVALAEKPDETSERPASDGSESRTRSNVSAEAREIEPLSVYDERGAKRADALRWLAESFLDRRREEAGSSADRYQIVVHIDQQVLASGRVFAAGDEDLEKDAETRHHAGPGRCELENGRALALETARRLSCDCSLVGVIEGEDGEPLSVGRKTRAIPAALRRALQSRDGGCRFPGCDRSRFTQAHHITHWAAGGETKLSNLVTLCHFHHRLIHEGGFGLRVTDDGVYVWTRPDGTRVGENGVQWRFRGSAELRRAQDALFALNLSREIEIDENTARCKWLGERMDYGIAIEHLIFMRDRRRASPSPSREPS